MRILVCGGRNYNDYEKVCEVLDGLLPTVVIHGDARGADSLADRWAREKNIKPERYPADWKKYRLAAGPIRNQEMLDKSKPDLVVAFPGVIGTADMIKRAKKAGVKVIEVL